MTVHLVQLRLTKFPDHSRQETHSLPLQQTCGVQDVAALEPEFAVARGFSHFIAPAVDGWRVVLIKSS